jgi:pSer/pThr/pTyr-binding forkhead associated (FHA) protein
MFDSHAMSKLSEPSEVSDLDQRLGLYRVFLKLYEHHRELLDEILDLENSDYRSRIAGKWQFVQGVMQQDQVYLMTNLLYEKTQVLIQPQHCWMIGRDRNSGIPIPDKRLSRRHAVVQYIEDQGFYLVDLNSTNGTFVNGEAVRRPILLKDGDRIRLGSLSFIFFLCRSIRQVEAIPVDVMQRLGLSSPPSAALENPTPANPLDEKVDEGAAASPVGSDRETFMFLNADNPLDEDHHDSPSPNLNSAQKADILDRFLNRS